MVLFGFKGRYRFGFARLLDTSRGGYIDGRVGERQQRLATASRSGYRRRERRTAKLEHELLPSFPGHEAAQATPKVPDGSIIVTVATNAPLEARQLREIAQRAVLGLGRTGLTSNTSSGDFIIAFSTTRLTPRNTGRPTANIETDDARLDALFEATAEATQAAVYNALFSARTMTGANGATIYGLPIERVRRMLSGDHHE